MAFAHSFLRSLVVLTMSLAPLIATAHPEESQPSPQKVNISFVQHDAVINTYKPLIQQAYDSLGIEVNFVKVDVKRSLDLLNNGEIDADVIRSEVVATKNPNVLLVEPALGEMDVVLYCQQNLICDETAMQSSRHILGLVGTLRKHHKLISEAKLSMVSFVNFSQMQKMFERGRIDYMINIIDPNSLHNHNIHIPHQTYNLFHYKTHHLVNKKLQPILPQLSQAIANAQKNIMLSYEH